MKTSKKDALMKKKPSVRRRCREGRLACELTGVPRAGAQHALVASFGRMAPRLGIYRVALRSPLCKLAGCLGCPSGCRLAHFHADICVSGNTLRSF